MSDNATISDTAPGSPGIEEHQSDDHVRAADDPAERPQLINAGSSIASSNPLLTPASKPQANAEPASAPFTLARAAQAAGVWNPGGAAAGTKQLPTMASANVAPGSAPGTGTTGASATAGSPMVVPFLGSGDAGEALRNGAVATSADAVMADSGAGAPAIAADHARDQHTHDSRPKKRARTADAAESHGQITSATSLDDGAGRGGSAATDKPSIAASATVVSVPPHARDASAAVATRTPAQDREAPVPAERDSASAAHAAPAAGGGDPVRADTPGAAAAVDGSAYISVEDAAELRAALEGCHAVPEAERALQLEPGGASAVIEKCASGTLQVADLMQLVRPVRLPCRRPRCTSAAVCWRPSCSSVQSLPQSDFNAATCGGTSRVARRTMHAVRCKRYREAVCPSSRAALLAASGWQAGAC